MMRRLLAILLIFSLSVIALSSDIHQAATEGNLDEVKKILTANPEMVNEPDNSGKSPLHSATYSGRIEVARYLIDQGADLNFRSGAGSVPLHGAAFYGHQEAVSLLLGKGADVNLANQYGYTPFLSAAAGGHLEIVKMLLQAGADKDVKTTNDDANAILLAGSSGNLALVDYFITLGFDVNSKGQDGEGMLHYAAYGGNIDLVKRLYDQGIDVNVESNNNVVPLHYAALAASKDVSEFLLDHGADPNIADAEGETPLHEAVIGAWRDTTGASLEIVKLLVNEGADVNKQTNSGMPALFWTIYNDAPEFAAYLVANGADLNLVNAEGLSALHEAVKRGAGDYIDLFIKNGARGDLKENVNGFTPLHLAAMNGNLEIIKSVLAGLDDINIKDKQDHTALYYASKYGHKQTAELLKAKGAREKDLEENFGYAKDLNRKLSDKEAVLWYLGHCGWAIKTNNNFLIFDYWTRGGMPTEPCLANGYVIPDEIEGQNITVFASHEHSDHYDSTIFSWGEQVENINYVFGFHPESLDQEDRMGYAGQPYEFVDFHTTKTIDDIEITSIQANDAGQGFLVKVDGLTIYHAGDHAGWREGQRDGFTSEIDFLKDKIDELDFAFVNVTGCHVQDTVALAEATFYTIDKLVPRILVPTHGIDREQVYMEYADKIHARGYEINVLCPMHRGDRFVYKNEQIM